jgi:hypothetical protein
MIIKISIITCLLGISQVIAGQSCSELLSLAEENYRNGQFQEIKAKLCNCFGIIISSKDGEIKPVKFHLMIDSMKKADLLYGPQLGSFAGYWNDFIPRDTIKRRDTDSFSYLEFRRAYLLLSKVYFELGVLELAEYFARKAIRAEPGTYLNDPDKAFNRVYNSQISTIRELSFGPVSGWMYTLPVKVINNRPGDPEVKYQTDGKIILGAQLNYFIRRQIILSFNSWFHGLRVVYLQSVNGGNNRFDFYFAEKQNWIKFPILVKWSPSRFNANEPFKAKVFFAGGFSVNYMTQTRATIIDLISDVSLYNYNMAPYRNRLNYEVMGEMMLRFRLGRNYLNLGFIGGYTFKEIVDKRLLGSSDNPLFIRYGIVENNYKLLSGAWKASYEIRFSNRKKIR